ncbi:hypothetical protein V1478_016919 [Vespula squamosa]|uniref:Uncharacterized protein n=1 Tax=Vespula squamosa TaxID=30214 RepID=A0ABD1ZXX4_VESSQ
MGRGICKGIEKIQWLHEFLSKRHSGLLLENKINILNVEDGMQYFISTELDNNEYLKCFSYKSNKFRAVKIVQT